MSFIWTLVSIAISIALTTAGFAVARRYVRDRLKFVDAVHTMKAPLIAGLVGWAVLMPLTIFPLIGVGTAILFGVSVALGVRAGSKDIKIGRLSGGY